MMHRMQAAINLVDGRLWDALHAMQYGQVATRARSIILPAAMNEMARTLPGNAPTTAGIIAIQLKRVNVIQGERIENPITVFIGKDEELSALRHAYYTFWHDPGVVFSHAGSLAGIFSMNGRLLDWSSTPAQVNISPSHLGS